MPQIFDNIKQSLLPVLRKTIDVAHKADFCVGYFNLRGWKQIDSYIEKFSGGDDNCCRLLVGMQRPPQEDFRAAMNLFESNDLISNQKALKLKKQIAEDFRKQLVIGIPTNNDEAGLQRLIAQLKSGKVVVKVFLKHQLHAKLYLLFRTDPINPTVGYIGSSNLTMSGLAAQGELNVDVMDRDACNKLTDWFQDRWNEKWCIDISKELIEILEESWASEVDFPPYHIYLKIVYHLARDARAGIEEFNLPTLFKNQLFEYQANAVKIAARHLHKKGGVIIGDVVGLGKTIVATALAKIYEDDFYLETLIICPKNLVEMWEGYVHKYQLHAKVLSISMAQNVLPDERRYRLLIIDESHNLRNKEGSRYKVIREYIQKNVERVILLTATPYNKSYCDLGNQLRLFINEDEDLNISPETFIASIGGRSEFAVKHQVGINTIAAFEKSSFTDDWNELMRLFLVRRTRSFIKNYYAETDETDGRKYLKFPDGTKQHFPDRFPKKVEFGFNEKAEHDQYAKLYSKNVVDIINGLNLPRYGLGQKMYSSNKLPDQNEKIIIDNLSRAGARIKGFARTNLFKRLESSGFSFMLSVCRQLLRNHLFLYAYENNQPLPIGKQETASVEDYLYKDEESGSEKKIKKIIFDESDYKIQAEELFSEISDKHKQQYKWIDSDFFSDTLKNNLVADNEKLLEIIKLCEKWDAENDRKLIAMIKLCNETHPNEKILVFTQYSDTAHYIFENLKNKIDNIECVTGGNNSPTDIAHRFSPKSNDKTVEKEIRVLISTDVLSEGQNLQDAHIIVNYDLPWAIIRLIQRAGRVDRIGQKSDKIYCYSFLPENGIEKIINLRKRLKQRIKENAETIGADEVFFEDDSINLLDLFNEKSGILDDESDMDVDLASHAYQIWEEAVKKNPKLKNIIPKLADVIYSAKEVDGIKENGVVVYTKTARDNDILTWIDENKNIVTQSQFEILKAVKCLPGEKPVQRIEKHHELVKFGVEHIRENEDKIGGQLGRKNGARYKIYMRLTRYVQANEGTLFASDELKRAVDDIYKYPLQEFARNAINRQIKAGVSDENLVKLVLSLKEDDKLSIINESESDFDKNPKIICSLGLIK